ncbi:serine/threonine-protein kinase minibrain isoform X2 [Procambarus clarkii]|uniref:serine/threonine-protein kinase minibrain isoform X2 n=1 Tax=Procambarus clarkii TaxID=6728 RepID=UPI001E672B0B|nr:serine/threonine-protein kinase minibrain-like isoform X2 [Procambarus clarkii]
MSTGQDSRGSMGHGGFHRWVKLSTDDLPLIRPPRHHMLAHITGGLSNLYEEVKQTKKEGIDEVIIPYHDSEKYKEDSKVDEEEAAAAETKNGHAEDEECAENAENEETEKVTPEESAKEEDNSLVDNSKKDDSGEGENAEDKKEESSQNEKKDDEGGGAPIKEAEEEEEEETTPYTDEEGEFSPEKEMPLLAGRFKYTQVLARGQSAIIIKVLDTFHKSRPLAIKVLHRVYKPIGSQEADILLELHRADPWLHVPFARLLNQFLYGPHYCLVFEYLSPTPLYTHYDQRDIREATALPHIRDLTVKLLTVLGFLYKQNVIHADLKPENILLRSEEDLASLMVVDFGNALRNTDEELSLYYSDFELQTLLYRAPEVIFGMKFSLEVDMWSLGCLLAECYLGEPLFMGKSKKEILNKITALLGPFPREFNDGEYAEQFSDFVGRPMSRYQRLENLRKRLNDCKDSMFLMLVERLLTYLPDRRFTPFEAACHPFVACSTPFLYLTPSPGYIRYPTVLLDMSTYPYLPGLPDDDDEDSASAHGRKRLALFSRYKRTTPSNASGQSLKQGQNAGQKDKDMANQGPNAGSGPNAGGPNAGSGHNAGSGAHGGNQCGAGQGGKTATRSDVKETLKSMGLRCEDFTISVYSREQAHAILRRQGVEVTPNNLPPRDKVMPFSGKGGYKNAKSSEMPKISHNMRPGNTVNSRNAITHYGSDNVDDDDDCVILDPPDMPKCPPKLPHQFQLMGTTVQVNRGAKRPSRPMANQPQAKRPNARPSMYYRKDHEQEYGAEASVQDTLKRLKNYNISITCRRNASGLRPQGSMVDSESDMENDSHLDSDDDGEDMTKYLECQIGEIEDMQEEEIFEDDLDIDCDDKDDVDYNPRGKKRRQKNKSPRKGKKSSESGSIGGDKGKSDSGVDEIPEIVPSVEMGELSDHPPSNNSENEYDHDPLADENFENHNELQNIMENAAQLEEDGEDNHDTNEENNIEEKTSEDNPVEEDETEENIEENRITEEDNKEDSGNVLGEYMETEEAPSPAPKESSANEEEEEIDEELEKELLGGDVGDGEEGDMEDL